MSECPHCGQGLPPPPIEGLFRGVKREIYKHVCKAGKHGLSTQRLFELVYAGTRDGGPLSGVKCLAVHISGMNTTLRDVGLQIAGERGRRPDCRYRLREAVGQ